MFEDFKHVLVALATHTFPPEPTFTEADVPSLTGKVFIVTGGNAGIGLELVKILYLKGGTVYIASRSPTRIAAAIEEIKKIPTDTPGHLKSLVLDLNDFSTIGPCVADFLAQESRLDVLWNNAGISYPRDEETGAADRNAVIVRVNCLGAFLLTKMLLPVLTETARAGKAGGGSGSGSGSGSVRVVFVSSGAFELNGPPGGLSLAELRPGEYSPDPSRNYSASKAGALFLANELDRRVRGDGVLSLVVSPGALKTRDFREMSWAARNALSLILHEPRMGAYSELWAGLSPDVGLGDGGRLAIEFGRWHPHPPEKLMRGVRSREEGGTGLAAQFWEWCEEQTKEYMHGAPGV